MLNWKEEKLIKNGNQYVNITYEKKKNKISIENTELIKTNIINNHNDILAKYDIVRNKDYQVSRRDLYLCYIKALKGNKLELNIIIDKLINKPEWIIKKYDIWSCVNYLDRILFGENVLKEIRELDSIENVGLEKCVGYSRGIILTNEYIKKYKDKEYIIMENDIDMWSGKKGKDDTKDIWIIYKPKFEQILRKYNKIEFEFERDNIFYIIKYIMENPAKGKILEFVKELFGEKN